MRQPPILMPRSNSYNEMKMLLEQMKEDAVSIKNISGVYKISFPIKKESNSDVRILDNSIRTLRDR